MIRKLVNLKEEFILATKPRGRKIWVLSRSAEIKKLMENFGLKRIEHCKPTKAKPQKTLSFEAKPNTSLSRYRQASKSYQKQVSI